ncbi:hypothetical protein DSO57_1006674 [Entomophthora muscae]|uniref:Uncharacterized protein n=1 Tax=Entomophthora muscae TaxID=34485 RepID=A0ACC2TIV0_9FUNG|nr:hypothetical protein DSO57_1006674 [Entomophthora muscae]
MRISDTAGERFLYKDTSKAKDMIICYSEHLSYGAVPFRYLGRYIGENGFYLVWELPLTKRYYELLLKAPTGSHADPASLGLAAFELLQPIKGLHIGWMVVSLDCSAIRSKDTR